MAVFTAEQKVLSRQLITTISGLQPHEETFEVCFQFVKSNFRHHRFLDVDSFKVTRSIKGLVEKFRVHAQPDRAVALDSLTQTFLSRHLHGNYTKSETHYGVLQLLLCLSERPTSAQWSPPHREAPARQDEGDGFDWAAYLREGIDLPSYSDTDSEFSQLSEDEQETDPQLAVAPALSDSAVGEELSDDDTPTAHNEQVCKSRSWLMNHVVFPYWDQTNPFHRPLSGGAPPPLSPSHPASPHPACGLAERWRAYSEQVDPFPSPSPPVTVDETNIVRETLWRAYSEQVDPFPSPSPPVTVDETNIVRETLWLLLGAEESFVYRVNQETEGREGEREVCVSRGVQLSHLTPLSLQRLLQQFASVATILLRMRRFIKSVTLTSCALAPPPSFRSLSQSHTYEAAADALTTCLQVFNDQLRDIERMVVSQKEFVSLLRLSSELHPACRDIKALGEVLMTVIHPNNQTEAGSGPHQCVVRLLDSVWNGLQLCDTLGEAGTASVAQLFPLWVMSVKPYLSAVGEWMVKGVLQDRHQELCIVRNEDVIRGASDYWERCFSVREPVPQFLQPVVDKVMLAGKSMQLIESTGKWKLADQFNLSLSGTGDSLSDREPSLTAQPPPTLYDDFLESLRGELLPEGGGEEGGRGGEGGRGDEGVEVGEGGRGESDGVGEVGEGGERGELRGGEGEEWRCEGEVDVGVVGRGEGDNAGEVGRGGEAGAGEGGEGAAETVYRPEEDRAPLEPALELRGLSPMLQEYLLSLTRPTTPLHNSSGSIWKELQKMMDSPRHSPLCVLIQNYLFPLILNRCTKASSCLMHILRTEFHLLDHFKTVQLFLLMEAGDTVHHFASDIFHRILRGVPWRDLLYLNSLLQEVLLPHYPHLENCLSVQVNNEETGRDLLASITSLSLHYQVPWPVTTVFPPAVMNLYNDIFHFLMQVKWAKWSLEGIQVKAHSQEASAQPRLSLLLHQLLLLRSKLLHFVNSVYHYLMTRILHSIGLKFQRQVSLAEDMDSVLALHREYVTTIFDRCLLNKKASIVKEAVLKTLRLTLNFRQKWELGLASFSYAEGEKMESEFSKCSHFLVTCLNNTVKRGSFPYLESLAFSLTTLKTDQKIFAH